MSPGCTFAVNGEADNLPDWKGAQLVCRRAGWLSEAAVQDTTGPRIHMNFSLHKGTMAVLKPECFSPGQLVLHSGQFTLVYKHTGLVAKPQNPRRVNLRVSGEVYVGLLLSLTISGTLKN